VFGDPVLDTGSAIVSEDDLVWIFVLESRVPPIFTACEYVGDDSWTGVEDRTYIDTFCLQSSSLVWGGSLSFLFLVSRTADFVSSSFDRPVGSRSLTVVSQAAVSPESAVASPSPILGCISLVVGSRAVCVA
jgi:hypothetical protein